VVFGPAVVVLTKHEEWQVAQVLPCVFTRLHWPALPMGWHATHLSEETLPVPGLPAWHDEQLECAACACKSAGTWQVKQLPSWPGGTLVVAGVLVVGPGMVELT
jgi:hypothetical protein